MLIEQTELVAVNAVEQIHLIIQSQLELSDNELLRELLSINDLNTLKKKLVGGSKNQAILVSAIIYFTANMAAMTTPVIASLKNLSTAWKNIVVGAPALAATISMMPFGREVDINGGKRAVLWFRALSTIGPIGFAILSKTVDFNAIESFDVPLAAMIACSLFAGFSLAAFPIGNNLRYWSKAKEIGFTMGIFGGISNLAPGCALFFYQATLTQLDASSIYILSAVISILGGLVAAKFYVASPYHQLLRHGLSVRDAVLIAKLFGQEKFPAPPDAPFWSDIFKTIKNYPVITTVFSFMGCAASGSNYWTNLSLAFILMKLFPDLLPQYTVYSAASISIFATSVRIVAGKLMDKFDPSNGVYSFYLSAALMLTGSSMLLFNRPLPSLSYTIVASSIMGCGYGAGSAATFKNIAAANIDSSGHETYDASKMTTLISTLGQSTGTWGPWLFAWIAYMNENQTSENNVDTFYLTFVITLVATGVLLLNECRKKDPLGIGHFRGGLFNSRQANNDVEYQSVSLENIAVKSIEQNH